MKALFVILFLLLGLSPVFGITDTRTLKEVGWAERLEDQIDLYSEILDVNNSKKNLDKILDPTKPTVFILVYYTCPRMCSFLLDGVLEAVSSNEKIRPGVDYNLVALSFDESDTVEIARQKKKKYMKNLNENEQWDFFVADTGSIETITQSVGFNFVKDGDEFAHPAGIIFLTKERKISRYLTGVMFDPRDFNLALLEASGGAIGKSLLSDKVLLYCYGFDPVGKKYALKALNVIKLGGVVTLLCIGVFMGFMWLKRDKKGNQ